MSTLFKDDIELFPTRFNEILQRVDRIDPIKYGKSRNFIDGAVTYLSPYISRGVISTKLILNTVLRKGYNSKSIEKFIQELAWRDYWQQIWVTKGEAINTDLKNNQLNVSNEGISDVILNATIGIEALDKAIVNFYETGYLHNHIRMYVASIACNIAQSHWEYPAKWMYYHLLDADWASNALSWQWVAGTNSHKKYYANQENINRYCYTNQKESFLDVAYQEFENLAIPEIFKSTVKLDLNTQLPIKKPITINPNIPTLIYNFYNLDPLWKKDAACNRVLLFGPSQFAKYPVSQKTIDFIIKLSENISDIQIYTGEFGEFIREYETTVVYYKEHPLNNHYMGIEESRDWMFNIKGYFPSFFGFWKKCKKELNY